ncbi:DUF1680-domain-containing protein [Heliocybe sulcata]|uniref:DUF1680-domain-containing protein n=1 Tax=Heliocybe sulcata TaxID=5364 RepID=A0A5C3MYR4_9AGAM|nr:DUF1680-domain-containing protein [Heliocybe sulcata]
MPLSLSNGHAVCVSLRNVHITSRFWIGRASAVREGALTAIYQQLKDTGRWDNLKLKWKEGDPQKPHRFWDSDIAKWLEAACYSLIDHPDPALAHLVEEAVDLIRGAQQEDGYLNSYYTVVEPGKRWTNIAWSHEMYCAGHLLEAALAHHEYTHSTRLLGPILSYIEHIKTVFGPDMQQKHGYPGHQCLELALIRAYETTQDSSLLSLASYFVEERGRKQPYDKNSETVERHYYDVEADARGEDAFVGPMRRRGDRFEYMQADKPIQEMANEGIRGHSVRAMYWLTAVAGVARLTGDSGLGDAVRRLWENTTEKRMYVTGGLGAVGEWEGFGPDYFFPNETGYLETCAAVGLVFFAHQMLLLDSFKPIYAEVMERALYNGVLVGMSLDGKGFFYDNPLATVEKDMQRSEWFEVACCPPNFSRLLGSLGKYIYTLTSSDTIYVHLYISSVMELKVSSGRSVKIRQDSDQWKGGSTFTLTGDARDLKRLKLGLRRPAGVHKWEIKVSGVDHSNYSINAAATLLYLAYNTVDASATTLSVTVAYDYTPRILRPHPLDSENHGCIAFAKGPFIYCLESVDNSGIADLRSVRVEPKEDIEECLDVEAFKKWDLQVVTLRTKGSVIREEGVERDVELVLVPYFAWANRGRSDLRVWLPVHRGDGMVNSFASNT